MELIKNDDSTWTLSKVSELEHLMLSRIPESADPNGCERALDRLYPSPIAPDAELDSDKSFDLENDWDEFITRMEGLDLNGKQVGLFVMGDDIGSFS